MNKYTQIVILKSQRHNFERLANPRINNNVLRRKNPKKRVTKYDVLPN